MAPAVVGQQQDLQLRETQALLAAVLLAVPVTTPMVLLTWGLPAVVTGRLVTLGVGVRVGLGVTVGQAVGVGVRQELLVELACLHLLLRRVQGSSRC